MNISILTVFDQLYEPFIHTSLIGRAQEKGIVHIDVQSFFSFVKPKERIDSPICGPGSGMLIRPEVVQKAVEAQEALHGKAFKIFFSPRGQKIDQQVLQSIAQKMQTMGHLMLLPARYEGMDERVETEYADMILSVGDFVLMGGDIPAMMLIEGVVRLLPHVVGKKESIETESFQGPFVDFPSYTEPIEWKGQKVPDILRSGNHAAIEQWRNDEAIKNSVKDHFEWLRSCRLTEKQTTQALSCIPHHYVALMHTDVLVGDEKRVGTTSVTSIDIHDIARSSKTYGIKNYFVVTPLIDQQKIVAKVLDFWKKGIGAEYNKSRYEAIIHVELVSNLQEVIEHIERREGKKPLIIATSARITEKDAIVTFYDQQKVWAHERPVLFLFGTGQGLTSSVIDSCDFLLVPVQGFSDFNHLSVRSAVAIILDRWLGINIKRW